MQAAPPTTVGSSQQSVGTPLRAIPPSVQLPTEHSTIVIHYLENSPIRVRGPITGRYYEFSSSRRVQCVDARDANSLLQTRFFRRS